MQQMQDHPMQDTDDPWIDKEFESRVRDTAYFLWEDDGRPHGREKEYWFNALERCLRQREADRLLLENPVGSAGTDGIDTTLRGQKDKLL